MSQVADRSRQIRLPGKIQGHPCRNHQDRQKIHSAYMTCKWLGQDSLRKRELTWDPKDEKESLEPV